MLGKHSEKKREKIRKKKELFPWKFSWYFLLMTHQLSSSEVKVLVPCSKGDAHWMS